MIANCTASGLSEPKSPCPISLISERKTEPCENDKLQLIYARLKIWCGFLLPTSSLAMNSYTFLLLAALVGEYLSNL
jgi:hypothetical protein